MNQLLPKPIVYVMGCLAPLQTAYAAARSAAVPAVALDQALTFCLPRDQRLEVQRFLDGQSDDLFGSTRSFV